MTRFEPLRIALEESGWSVCLIEQASDCWWAREIWKLNSEWTPYGLKIFLSLLVDPMDVRGNIEACETSVWAVGLNETVPEYRSSTTEMCVSLSPNFSNGISKIVSNAAAVRMVGNR